MDLEYLRNKIIKLVEEKGHPRELGALVADNLGSENTMIRMIGYLSHSPRAPKKSLMKCWLSAKTGTTGGKRRKRNFTSRNIISICGT